jgi:hypothetical protein
MKANVSYSGFLHRRGQAKRASVTIAIEPEGEAEKAILRLAHAGTRELYIHDSGNAELIITMPRGKNP